MLVHICLEYTFFATFNTASDHYQCFFESQILYFIIRLHLNLTINKHYDRYILIYKDVVKFDVFMLHK